MSAARKLIDHQQRSNVSRGASARSRAALAPDPIAVLIALFIAIACGGGVALLAILAIEVVRRIGF
jgi:hypothetical protein